VYGNELDWPQDCAVIRGNYFNFQFEVASLDATGATVTMTWTSGTPGAGAPTTATVSVATDPSGTPTSTFVWQASNVVTALWVAGNYPYTIQYNDTLGRGLKFGHGAIIVG
jgi:hypothetical protein